MEPVASLSILRLAADDHDRHYLFQLSRTLRSPYLPSQIVNPPVDLAETVHIDASLQEDLQRRVLVAVDVLRMLGHSSTGQKPDDAPLADLGRTLYTRVLPRNIRSELEKLPPELPLILLVNDPGLPWELLHDGDDFLSLKRAIGRRLLLPDTPRPSLPRVKDTRRALIVADPRGDLPSAASEGESLLLTFDTAAESIETDYLGPTQATQTAVRERLASGRYDLIHFAGHADGQALHLADGELSAGAIAQELRGQPFVFLNACRTARESEIGDLVSAFLSGGALAVVGTLWNIEDSGSIGFARWFYSQLLEGLSAGEALRRTRQRLRKEFPGPLWAHYTLFGDPQLYVMGLESRDARQVTTLVVRLKGFEALFGRQPLDVAARLQKEVVTALTDIAVQHDGRPWPQASDRIPVHFGLPRRSEDDARRAIVSGLKMIKAVNDFSERERSYLDEPLTVQIGVSTGQVISSRHKEGSGFDYGIAGEVIDIATRLAAASANGEIVVDETTQKQAENFFAWETRQTLVFGNGVREIAAYAVSRRAKLGASPEQQREGARASSFIGRARELTDLQRWWSEVRAGLFRLVTVLGPAGVGKSRLVRTFRDSVSPQRLDGHTHHIRWLRADCQEYEKESSYALLSQVVRALSRIERDMTEEQILAKLDEFVTTAVVAAVGAEGSDKQLSEVVEENVALLSQVLGLSFTVPSIATLDPDLRQKKLAGLIQALIQATAMEPFVLELEDLQWADDASLAVLHESVKRSSRLPFLCIAVHRSDWTLPWTPSPSSRSLYVAELEAEEQRALLLDVLGNPVSDSISAQILDSTGGNPLFIEEMAHSLAESTKATGTRELLELPELPDRLEAVIQARLDRLPPSARQALLLAAVIGQQFDRQLLYNMRDESGRERLDVDLDELLNRNLITPGGGFYPDLQYAFAHATIRQVGYSNILSSRRRSLHRAVGSLIEDKAEVKSSPDAFAALLAHHYFASDDRSRAIYWCVAAALRAAGAWDNQAALLWYERALSVLDSVATSPPTVDEQQAGMTETALAAHRIGVLRGAADVRWKCGDHEQAVSLLEDALALAGTDRQFTPATRADLYYRLVHVFEAQGNFDLAWRALQEGQNELTGEDNVESARLFIWRGLMHHRSGEPVEAINWSRRGISVAHAVDSLRDQAMGHNLLAIVYRVQGKLDLAEAAAKASLQHYEREGFIPGVERATSNLACVYQDREDWQAATALFEKSLALSKQTGEVYRQAGAYTNLGEVARLQGDWEAAVTWYEQGREMAQRHSLEEIEAILMMNMGAVMIAQEQPHEALQILDQSRALFDKVRSRQYLAELTRYVAEAHRIHGRLHEAQSLAHQAAELAAEMAQDSEWEATQELLKLIRQAITD